MKTRQRSVQFDRNAPTHQNSFQTAARTSITLLRTPITTHRALKIFSMLDQAPVTPLPCQRRVGPPPSPRREGYKRAGCAGAGFLRHRAHASTLPGSALCEDAKYFFALDALASSVAAVPGWSYVEGASASSNIDVFEASSKDGERPRGNCRRLRAERSVGSGGNQEGGC